MNESICLFFLLSIYFLHLVLILSSVTILITSSALTMEWKKLLSQEHIPILPQARNTGSTDLGPQSPFHIIDFSLCCKSPDSASFNILFSKDPQMFLPDIVHYTSSCWEMKAAVNAFGALSKSCIDFRSYIAIPLSDMWEQGLPIYLSQVLLLVCLNIASCFSETYRLVLYTLQVCSKYQMFTEWV